MHLRLGSRGSKLALWQSHHVAALLEAHGHSTEILLIRTTGDRMQDPAYAAAHPVTPELDGKGIFIKEIEEALLAGTIDLAVHSLKDLPTQLDERFTLAAIPERADPRDALLCPEWLQLHTLPQGARVGTTSPRRVAQLLAHRPDLEFIGIRGNIDTRIRKLAAGECDALVLACAGIDRLGGGLLRPVELDPQHPEFGRAPHIECITHPDSNHLAHAEHGDDWPGQADWIRERFDPAVLCPAPGQGALAIETLAREAEVIAATAVLDDASTRFAVEAERWLLHGLGGGCSLPVGALCTLRGGAATLQANVTAPDGERMITLTEQAASEESAEVFGTRIAAHLVTLGANALLNGEDVLDAEFADSLR
ncbi:hydroxymethylbilane synthase [Terriglobus aquaticus]|uniref:Porphobilinogen deaminase n=1 Tax=Terriglobus aquaticus TaxID=940139 RepID=A0ABW9KPC3_9BACT|nr:hydroxymethylbilane synthase [Terriglobus aquaticus]